VIDPRRFVPEIPAVASSRFDVATPTPGSARRIVRDPRLAVQADGLIEGQLAGLQALPDDHALLVEYLPVIEQAWVELARTGLQTG
jgi:hypothetical protein